MEAAANVAIANLVPLSLIHRSFFAVKIVYLQTWLRIQQSGKMLSCLYISFSMRRIYMQQHFSLKTTPRKMKFSAFALALVCLFISSGHIQVKACTFYVINKCTFPIWPATAPNQGHPVVANGGFHLSPGRARKFQTPGDWSGRIWARTGCNFDGTNHKPACETGDCDGKLECNGSIGKPPATLVELTLQVDKNKPSFYDVSIVDGYNLPVAVDVPTTSDSQSDGGKCSIGGCRKDLKAACPEELQVRNSRGEVVACKSACLAFDLDSFCCRNEYGSPERCRPNEYSKMFKRACPWYFSYAFDAPPPLVNCPADDYVITFCPGGVGDGIAAD